MSDPTLLAPAPRVSAPTRFAPARTEDASSLARLAAATLPEAWSEAGFRDQLDRPEARVWLARSAGDPCGYLAAHRVLDELQILSLGVLGAWRRQRIGRRLVEAAIAAEPGLREVHLEVRSNDPVALAFYRALGFRPRGRRPGFYAGGVAALCMHRVLAAGLGPEPPHGA